MRFFLYLLIILSFFNIIKAQNTVVNGKVIDSNNGSSIPFANVVFSGTTKGTTTDFDGNFSISTHLQVDSIEVKYIGYKKRIKNVQRGKTQFIQFELEEKIENLEEFVFYSGENPAFPIMRNVIKNKSKNDRRELENLEYQSYTKTQVSVSDISEIIKKRKFMTKIQAVVDSIEIIAGENGKAILPIFVSEAISNIYYRKNPLLKKELILKTNVKGVGIEDNTYVNQFIGNSLHDYNFYMNSMIILGKPFTSPISDWWKLHYNYYLIDSTKIDGDFAYRIDFQPKNKKNRLFEGTMWITKEDYAIKRIDAKIGKEANINFIESIKIQSDFVKTEKGPWVPQKTRVIIDIAQITNFSAGFLLSFYFSNKDIELNIEHPLSFYQVPLEMDIEAENYDKNYWDENRHEVLTATEKNMYKMVDTIKDFPIVKATTDILGILGTGYYISGGNFDYGKFSDMIGNNDIEGFRIGFGMRTSYQFSSKYTIGGYLAYGYDDKEWKYQVYYDYIFDRRKWSSIRFEHQRDVNPVWQLVQDIPLSDLFATLARFSNMSKSFYFTKNKINFEKQLWTGFSQFYQFTHYSLQSNFDYTFKTSDTEDVETQKHSFEVAEVSIGTHYSKDELFALTGNTRVSLGGSRRWPVFDFVYTYGIPNLLNSKYEYHRLKLSVEKKFRMGFIGLSRLYVEGGQVYGVVPYPLLFIPTGNETILSSNRAFNTMNFFHFAADKYISMMYRHHFEGYFLNKIPLFRRLNLREIVYFNAIYGGMSAENIEASQYLTAQNSTTLEKQFQTLSDKPFMEAGFGVENIFKFFSISSFYRLSYKDLPGNKVAIKLGFNISI